MIVLTIAPEIPITCMIAIMIALTKDLMFTLMIAPAMYIMIAFTVTLALALIIDQCGQTYGSIVS